MMKRMNALLLVSLALLTFGGIGTSVAVISHVSRPHWTAPCVHEDGSASPDPCVWDSGQGSNGPRYLWYGNRCPDRPDVRCHRKP